MRAARDLAPVRGPQTTSGMKAEARADDPAHAHREAAAQWWSRHLAVGAANRALAGTGASWSPPVCCRSAMTGWWPLQLELLTGLLRRTLVLTPLHAKSSIPVASKYRVKNQDLGRDRCGHTLAQ